METCSEKHYPILELLGIHCQVFHGLTEAIKVVRKVALERIPVNRPFILMAVELLQLAIFLVRASIFVTTSAFRTRAYCGSDR